ncbi:MAG TPA: hypothetical protein VHF91_06230, partial [Acidimicrobiales bacterium]|nr:hypothetical protein [Acidimicrobiales bacterium]
MAVLSPLSWAVALAGVAALLARPWFLPAGVEVEWRVAFFITLGVCGAAWPLAGAFVGSMRITGRLQRRRFP